MRIKLVGPIGLIIGTRELMFTCFTYVIHVRCKTIGINKVCLIRQTAVQVVAKVQVVHLDVLIHWAQWCTEVMITAY